MSQADAGIHITAVGEARPHHRRWTRARTDRGALQRAVSWRRLRTGVADRRSGSSNGYAFGTVVSGAALIAAAVAGLGIVIVVTGVGGLVFLVAGGVVGVELFRASDPEPPLSVRTDG